MAREKVSQEDGDARVVRKKKKDKSRKGSRPLFCPNKSKSFNASRSFRQNSHISTTALKKNNEELAKSLNKCKGVIAQLQSEKLDMERQLMDLRAERPQIDEHFIETEVQRRLSATLLPVKTNLNNAIDNMVVLSGNLTQSLQSVSAPLRMSTMSQASVGTRGSSIGSNRSSSIGVGANFRMRPIINFTTRDGASTGVNSSASNSPPKQLSKVTPMVAGHAITRPRIQLTRMDVEAMSAAREREHVDQEESAESDSNNAGSTISTEDENEERYEEVGSTPPHPGRSRFDLTNIGEEPSFLEETRVENSIIEEDAQEVEASRLEMVEEINNEDVSPDRSIVRRSRSSLRQSSGLGRHSLIPSGNMTTPVMPSISARRSDISASPDQVNGVLSQCSQQISPSREPSLSNCRLSRPPLRQLSSPSTSPQVDILKTQRHPAVVIPDLVEMNHPALPSRYSQPCSTPFLPTPSPANKRISAPIYSVDDFPENPSESFLEHMIDSDPLEGPSWLFNPPVNKKRRSSVARKLSAVMSESERGSSARLTSSLDSSDLDACSAEEDTSSGEVSGFLLERDLLETAGVITAPETIIDNSALKVNKKDGSHSNSSIVVDDDMDLTRPAEAVSTDNSSTNGLNNSDQENAPVKLVRTDNINESILSISVTNIPRTPLSSLTYTDPSGEVVKFNPRTDTGVTVAGLREARILLDNVGMGTTSGVSTTPYKLSDCYIDLSPGRSMSLDQLFSLGLRAGIASPIGSPNVKKRKFVSEMGSLKTPPRKKTRTTDLPGMRLKGVRASLDLIPPCNMAANKVDKAVVDNPIETPKESMALDKDKLLDNTDVPLNVKKKSILPSFVRLEKSPVKKITEVVKTKNYESIDEIPCVGTAKGNEVFVDGVTKDKTEVFVEDVSERSKRRKTKVDYAAILSEYDNDPTKKSKGKQSGKVVDKKLSTVSKNEENSDEVSSHLANNSQLVRKKRKENSTAFDQNESSVIEPYSIVPVESTDESEVSITPSMNSSERQIVGNVPPPSEDVPSTSRGSSVGFSSIEPTKGSTVEEAECLEGRSGRSRRGQVKSYKEPPLGKKLRQGDAGSTSVYTDFKPEAKSKKKKKVP